MADSIKAGFDIAFQDPAWTMGTSQDLVTFIQGIGTASFQPKAIGMAVGQGFRDGIEAEQVEGLHGSVGHGGDPQRTLLAVALGNVDPAERLRSIAVPTAERWKAADLASGVFQRIPSTPGVRAPELLMTRKMARARPLYEWVSR